MQSCKLQSRDGLIVFMLRSRQSVPNPHSIYPGAMAAAAESVQQPFFSRIWQRTKRRFAEKLNWRASLWRVRSMPLFEPRHQHLTQKWSRVKILLQAPPVKICVFLSKCKRFRKKSVQCKRKYVYLASVNE